MKFQQINRMLVFATVVEHNSFTAAAEALNITRSMVSQHVKQLEQSLSIQLMNRTTRRFTLTPAGERYFDYCRDIMQMVNQADRELMDSPDVITGPVRVTLPAGKVEDIFMALLAKFSTEHPQIRLTTLQDDEKIDLVAEKIDLAVQMGWPQDSQFKAFKVADFSECLVTSPQYLRDHGNPSHPQELLKHRWVTHSSQALPKTWRFKDKHEQEVRIRHTPWHVANTIRGVQALIEQHCGIGVLPDMNIQSSLKDGGLIQLLPDYKLRDGGIYVLHTYQKHVPNRIRLLLDFIKNNFTQFRTKIAV